jgi:AcrR family transcriptional regulator
MENAERISRRSDAVANRTKVLDAARRVFAEQGLDAEIKDVADCAGVGVATIYRGFGSKSDLIEATVEQVMAELGAILDAAAREEDPVEGFRGLLTNLAGFIAANGWLVQAMLAQHIGHEVHVKDHFRALIAGILDRGVALGRFRADLPYDSVFFLFEGAMMTLAVRPDIKAAGDGARLATGLVDLLTVPPAAV